MPDTVYLDHAASAPLHPDARHALEEGYRQWANPSSPHSRGRAARALLEDARARLCSVLDWSGEVIFTSGASEALSLAISRCRLPLGGVLAVEHDAVLRLAGEGKRLPVDNNGLVIPFTVEEPALFAIQHVNSETGVIQPVTELTEEIHAAGGAVLADCSQSAGKIPLPDADMIVLSAHKFGGPIGIGALLVRDWALLQPCGGQERGYRPGTEAMPLALAMVAALEAGMDWVPEASRLRMILEREITASGGKVIASGAQRLPTIGSYSMPGVSSRAQLIHFDTRAISVSAGSACSSGSMKPSHVMEAMAAHSRDVIRVSIGRDTTEDDICRFLEVWRELYRSRREI